MEKLIGLRISVSDSNDDRCGTQFNSKDGRCQWLEKIRGTYHCSIWDEEVDLGDDEETDDYLFHRCRQCKDAVKRVEQE